jgi:diguanylate cyclase (GGDEF)-like protein/PAS domain S-box-containing protein
MNLEDYCVLVEGIKDYAVFLLNPEGFVMTWNQGAKQITGYEAGEIIGCQFSRLYPSDNATRLKAHRILEMAVEENRYEERDWQVRRDGSLFWANLVLTPVTGSDGGLNGFAVITRDLTNRKMIEEEIKCYATALEEASARYEALIAASNTGAWEYHDNSGFLWCSPEYFCILGRDIHDFDLSGARNMEQTWIDLMHPEDLKRASQNFDAYLKDPVGMYEQQFRMLHRDGQWIWIWSRGKTLRDEEGNLTNITVGTNIDVTERKRAEEALRDSEKRYRELSIVDELTQLYNSRQFYFQLKIELDRSNRYKQPLSLLLLDLDNFKAFNDAYGHVEGDQVLRRLGQVVKRCLRETDLAYRYGGEEFTVLLPMTTSADGAVTAERIRTEFKKEIFSPVQNHDVHLTVSIGIAQYKPQEDMKAFVHRVDQLMYQAKKNGKDRVCHEL